VAATVQIATRMITDAAAAPVFNPWRRADRSRFGWAGLVSGVVHLGLALLVMSAVVHVPRMTPPIRVSLVDPAPPPPAGNGNVAPQAPAVVAPHAEPEHVVEKTPLKPRPVRRVQRPAKPVAANPQPPAPVAVAAPDPGEINGVPGGVLGGRAGGTVGGTGHTLITADEAARQPIPIKKVMPEYPPIARMRGIEGQVVLEVILSPDGRVEPDITVLQSVPLLDAAAIAAMRQWRFHPARDQTGEPLRVTLRVPVRFVLR
jgi:protein TonB